MLFDEQLESPKEKAARFFCELNDLNTAYPKTWIRIFDSLYEIHGKGIIGLIKENPAKHPQELLELDSFDIYEAHEKQSKPSRPVDSVYRSIYGRVNWASIRGLEESTDLRVKGRVRDMWNTTNAFYRFAHPYDAAINPRYCSVDFISDWFYSIGSWMSEKDLPAFKWDRFRWSTSHSNFHWHVRCPQFRAKDFPDAGPCKNPETYFPRRIDRKIGAVRLDLQWP